MNCSRSVELLAGYFLYNVRSNAQGQCGYRQRRIYSQSGRNDRCICDIKALVKGPLPLFGFVEHVPELIYYPILSGLTHSTASQRMRGMGKTAQDGVVDEFGHVFDKSKQ